MTRQQLVKHYVAKASSREAAIRATGLRPEQHDVEVAKAREAHARRALAVSEAAWLKAKRELEVVLDRIDAG